MDRIVELARELGAALQQDERYIRIQMAQSAADEDKDLQDAIGEFNLKRISLQNESARETQDEAKIEQLTTEVSEVYTKIMENPSMIAYNAARPDLDRLLETVARIITLSAQGEDPYAIPESSENCSGNCSSCGGCH
ncbi:MAG: YlbF family regulator [Clostridia bacterium]|nr:YlbF family regulator [Clostridia bacterium]MBQ2940589.1 YlbF family regulator [Clostridia bacterium]